MNSVLSRGGLDGLRVGYETTEDGFLIGLFELRPNRILTFHLSSQDSPLDLLVICRTATFNQGRNVESGYQYYPRRSPSRVHKSTSQVHFVVNHLHKCIDNATKYFTVLQRQQRQLITASTSLLFVSQPFRCMLGPTGDAEPDVGHHYFHAIAGAAARRSVSLRKLRLCRGERSWRNAKRSGGSQDTL